MLTRSFLLSVVAATIFGVAASMFLPTVLLNPAWADDDDGDGDDDDDDDDDRPLPRAELVVSGLSDAQTAILERSGFVVVRAVQSELLRDRVTHIFGPRGRTANAALLEVRRIAPNAIAARNDRYVRSRVDRYRPQGEPCGDSCAHFSLTGWTAKFKACPVPVAIGVIDTRVDDTHPALAGAEIEVHTVRRAGHRPSDSAHGTGVVSLLLGQGGAGVVGILPRAKVVAVDPFHRTGSSDATEAFDLIAAFDVLSARNVRVINMSLSGPGNALVEQGIRRLVEQGTTLVAAAGPSSAAGTGYPARYDGVVAVSSVDAALRASRLSARGDHISYAGPGVGIAVAAPDGKSRLATGTSFAAPFVSAAAAIARSRAPGANAATVDDLLRDRARDLGPPGRDPIFGWGLIQFPDLGAC